jgi:type II secretion system protein G
MKTLKQKGFTLIELLVVVAIIGVLATIVLSSLSNARAQARDARRVSEMKNLETALEMYYLDNNGYPPMFANTYGSTANIPEFETAMAPYINIDLQDKIYRDDDPRNGNLANFFYISPESQNGQNYGMQVQLEVSRLGETDGGSSSINFELGPNPKYCMDKYTGGDKYWLNRTDRCNGGN